jgi:hypothetical protein
VCAARRDHRLLSDHAFPFDFLHVSARVADEPVAPEELHLRAAVILDADVVGEDELLCEEIRLPVEIDRANADSDIVGGGDVVDHGLYPDVDGARCDGRCRPSEAVVALDAEEPEARHGPSRKELALRRTHARRRCGRSNRDNAFNAHDRVALRVVENIRRKSGVGK